MNASFFKGKTTHATLDNNDGKQETLTGKGTSHDTNFTIFQPINVGETFERPQLPPIDDGFLRTPIEECMEVPPYKIGKRVSPRGFANVSCQESNELLIDSFRKDILWAVIVYYQHITNRPVKVGSWSQFQRSVSVKKSEKSHLEYLPTVLHPPDYPVCKSFLDNLVRLCQELDLNFIFLHGDEQVYAKLAHILWENPELYRKIIIVMGGFHELRVFRKNPLQTIWSNGIQTVVH